MRKNKVLKISATVISVLAFCIFVYYYKAPSTFTLANAVPITLLTFFLFAAMFTTIQLFTTPKKALEFSLLIVSLLFVKHFRIIPIITYAICIPLLFISNKKSEPTVEEI